MGSRIRWMTMALALSIASVLTSNLSAEEKADPYVCPPCGHDCLKTVYDKPGGCGECGMQLVRLSEVTSQPTAPAPASPRERKKVAVLVFDGVQIIDYTGPWEIFGHAGYRVFTVANQAGSVTTTFGMKVAVDHSLEDHPEPDIVLVPGGNVRPTQNDPAVREWLNMQAKSAEVVLSVCNGAYILAKAGLLKGLKATTTRSLVDGLANAGPDITVMRDVRYVDNGKIVTSGGLSAGMDAALHVVSRLEGADRAKRIALGIEYDWNE